MAEGLHLARISVIGFGEAGGILGADLAALQGPALATYDILFANPAQRSAMLAKAARAGVSAASSLAEAIDKADLIISAVTAGAAREVANSTALLIKPGQIFFEINSVSPQTRRDNCRAIERAGGDYVEAAVMAPVPPQRLKVPMLLGGKRAAEVAQALGALGFNATAVATEVGVAAAIKMCRSIMVKGLEALTLECMLVARRYGAEEAVLKSLHATYPSMGWTTHLPDYLISRVAEHGRRRSEEMMEVVQTLLDANLEPTMARATASAQAWLPKAMEQAGLAYAGEEFSWRRLADALAVAASDSHAPRQSQPGERDQMTPGGSVDRLRRDSVPGK
jgi:3-hydroxyisobutyrate dehydrogenase-like beta-hydroxyacid dehydrogenase